MACCWKIPWKSIHCYDFHLCLGAIYSSIENTRLIFRFTTCLLKKWMKWYHFSFMTICLNWYSYFFYFSYHFVEKFTRPIKNFNKYFGRIIHVINIFLVLMNISKSQIMQPTLSHDWKLNKWVWEYDFPVVQI